MHVCMYVYYSSSMYVLVLTIGSSMYYSNNHSSFLKIIYAASQWFRQVIAMPMIGDKKQILNLIYKSSAKFPCWCTADYYQRSLLEQILNLTVTFSSNTIQEFLKEFIANDYWAMIQRYYPKLIQFFFFFKLVTMAKYWRQWRWENWIIHISNQLNSRRSSKYLSQYCAYRTS